MKKILITLSLLLTITGSYLQAVMLTNKTGKAYKVVLNYIFKPHFDVVTLQANGQIEVHYGLTGMYLYPLNTALPITKPGKISKKRVLPALQESKAEEVHFRDIVFLLTDSKYNPQMQFFLQMQKEGDMSFITIVGAGEKQRRADMEKMWKEEQKKWEAEMKAQAKKKAAQQKAQAATGG